jgi:formylglycine-generating enzyme required for sulfatase activity
MAASTTLPGFAVAAFAVLALGGCGRSAELPGDAPPGMVWVPGGRFLMGGADPHANAAERPVHAVTVDGFFMDVHVVTNDDFREFVDATGYITLAERTPTEEEIRAQLPPGAPRPDPAALVAGSVVFAPTRARVSLENPLRWWRFIPGASWRHPQGPQSDLEGKGRYPVVHVAWADARAYLEWKHERLPTEAEWEFAARGGRSQSLYAWGDAPFDPAHPQANIYEDEFPMHAAEPRPVGSFPSTGFGLYDMAGNVWQWTADWYAPDTYARDAERGEAVNPTGPVDPGAPPLRVLRGGSFLCNDSYCRGYRVSARSPGDPASGASHIGFRGVMSRAQWLAQRHE